MFLPISDANPLRHIRTAWITGTIIVACIGIFVVEAALPESSLDYWFARLAYTPAQWFGPARGTVDMRALVQEPLLILSPVTSQFLHAGLWHLVVNILFLRVFGDNIEDALGHGRFLFFYLLCGVVAAAAQTLPDPHESTGMVGASGAISGIIGAYVVLHPTARIRILLFWFFRPVVPAFGLLGLWFVMQILFAVGDNGESRVAWWAHIGGFVFGAATIKAFARGRPAAAIEQGDSSPSPGFPASMMRTTDRVGPTIPSRPWTSSPAGTQRNAPAAKENSESKRPDVAIDSGLLVIWLAVIVIFVGITLAGFMSWVIFWIVMVFAVVGTLKVLYFSENDAAESAASLPSAFDAAGNMDQVETALKNFDRALKGLDDAPRAGPPEIIEPPRPSEPGTAARGTGGASMRSGDMPETAVAARASRDDAMAEALKRFDDALSGNRRARRSVLPTVRRK